MLLSDLNWDVVCGKHFVRLVIDYDLSVETINRNRNNEYRANNYWLNGDVCCVCATLNKFLFCKSDFDFENSTAMFCRVLNLSMLIKIVKFDSTDATLLNLVSQSFALYLEIGPAFHQRSYASLQFPRFWSRVAVQFRRHRSPVLTKSRKRLQHHCEALTLLVGECSVFNCGTVCRNYAIITRWSVMNVNLYITWTITGKCVVRKIIFLYFPYVTVAFCLSFSSYWGARTHFN